jgi:hydroxymethylbilane synthase
LPDDWTVSPEQLVWAAGGTTWRRLAARGVWVNGCADGLGDEEHPNVAAIAEREPRWLRLTHTDALHADGVGAGFSRPDMDAVATYSVQTTLPEDLSQRTHFFWPSGSLFREALSRWPEIANCWHASGPGRTSHVIRSTLGPDPQFRVCLDYDEWLKEILE